MKFPALFWCLASVTLLGLAPAHAAEVKSQPTTNKTSASKTSASKTTVSKTADTPKKAVKKKSSKTSKNSKKKAEEKVFKSVPAATVFPETTISGPLPTSIAKVELGHMPCELGNVVTVTADSLVAGDYHLRFKDTVYHMQIVPTTTGAIRLEDKTRGAVWLQLGTKSMLMNHKLGQRLADECQSPQQAINTKAMLLAPAVSLLDPLPPSSSPSFGK